MDLLMTILSGGLLGLLGQAIRVIAGLKKLNDETQTREEFREKFSGKELLLSLLIGFTAGALAKLFIDEVKNEAVIAAGYAGADFIEAFMKKKFPTDRTKNVPAA